jgi:homoserine kinase
MTAFRTDPVRVRAPATSANLGPGYDALGLALDLHDEVTARVTSDGLQVQVSGEGDAVTRDETHLVVRAMRAAFARLGDQPPGLQLSCLNRIPHGRGLGSSAAAIVTGLLLARALVPDGTDRFADSELFALAVELEGHPDNVAACFYGGLTVAWADYGTAHAVRADVIETIRPVLFVPPFESATTQARGVLPATVPHTDAAFTVGRSALLVAALTGAVPASPDVLLAATEDRLHQEYRAPMLSQTTTMIDILRTRGTPAVVSGAGPAVLALASNTDEADRLAQYSPRRWRCLALAVDKGGAGVL